MVNKEFLKFFSLVAVLTLLRVTGSECNQIIQSPSPSRSGSVTSSPKLPSSDSEIQFKLHRPMLDGRIIGGNSIDIAEAPYDISLRIVNHKCGGILIAKNWILTAGHCITNLQPYHYSIYMGSANSQRNGLIVKVEQLYRHPNYTKNLDYDFSLIKLTNYNASGFNVAIAKLPKKNEEIRDDTKLRVYGWETNESNSSREIIKAIDVVKINSSKCHDLYANRGGITDRMFCASNVENDKGICMADSGGPIVSGDKAIGIVSWGYGCRSPKYPNVYAKISFVRDWIKSTCDV